MKTRTRRMTSALVLSSLLAVSFASNLAFAQSTYLDETQAILALIPVAQSSLTYAQVAVKAEAGTGGSTAAQTAEIEAGNSSLAFARASLQSGNLTAGLAAVHDAMGNFSLAATGATSALVDGGFVPSLQLQEYSSTVVALNGSANSISEVIDQTCASASVNSSMRAQFSQDCSAAKVSTQGAQAELSYATQIISAASQQGANSSAVPGVISLAYADLDSAEGQLSALTALSYAARAEAFVSGPLAGQSSAAAVAVKNQTVLSGWLGADYSTWQTTAGLQVGVSNNIASSASAVDAAISAVSMGPVTSSATSEASTLSQVLSTISSISSGLSALPISAAAASGIQSDVSSAQSSASAYSSALSTLEGSAGSFSGETAGGVPAYASEFSSDSNSATADGAAFSSSFASLQAELAEVSAEFPLVSALSGWSSSLGSLSATLSSDGASLQGSLVSASSSLGALSGASASLATQVQGASQVEVSSTLIQNVSAVYSEEGNWLSGMALVSLSSAVSSLSLSASLGSAYSASAQALLGDSVTTFGTASQGLSSAASVLAQQGQSTSSSMSSAEGYVTSDLSARSQAESSAESLVSQALSAFGSGNVAQGSQLFTDASAQYTLASQEG